MVKLSDKKIRWIIRHVGKDMTTRQAADIYNMSIRRVQQLVKEYKETGRVPHLIKKEDSKDSSCRRRKRSNRKSMERS